ncbi:glycosyltransferase [bacterium]|nr:glycosyltransferase [bacterium]
MKLRSLNVCLIITGLDRGGAETQVVRLAHRLIKRGHRLSVISVIEPGVFGDVLQETGVELHSLHIPRGKMDPRIVTRAVSLFRKISPDVIVSFMFHATLTARIAGRIAGVPVIIGSVRGESFGEGGWAPSDWKVRSREIVFRLTAFLGDSMTTMSKATGRLLVTKRIVKSSELRVIPNIVKIADRGAPPNNRKNKCDELGISEDVFLFVNMARIHAIKDHGNLVKTVEKAVALTDRPFHVAVAGGGDVKPFEELAAKLGVANRITFLGDRSDAAEWFEASDAVVHSSFTEGLPNALIEAHAHEKAVAATTAGGTAEVVRDGISGFVVPIRDPEALAGAMLKLMEMTAEERAAFGKVGREWVIEQYSEEEVIDRWEALFAELLSSKGIQCVAESSE